MNKMMTKCWTDQAYDEPYGHGGSSDGYGYAAGYGYYDHHGSW